MPFQPDSDYWIEIPAGRYRVGLEPAEAKRLAEQSAAFAKEEGVDLSPNERKMLVQAAKLLDTSANPRWLEEYLLAHFPPQDVELPPFAIARRPVTTAELERFMAETGEVEVPRGWARSNDNRKPELPVSGVSWAVATAFAEWAGARLPFEHEWERALRGLERRLFPWGDEHRPLGPAILRDNYPNVLPCSTTRTPEGIEGALVVDEWCVDLWSEPNVDYARWDEQPSPAWHRVLRGGTSLRTVVPNMTFRMSGDPFAYTQETGAIRLVRADGRQIPGDHPRSPPNKRAVLDVRTFEVRVLGRAVAALHDSPVTREHSILVESSGWFRTAPGADKVALKARNGVDNVRAGLPTNPKTEVYGLYVACVSKESMRRIPKEHGVFIWTLMYRLDEKGVVRARPVTAFRMASDKNIHRFENRFRPNEVDTALADINVDTVRNSIVDGFQFYEIHADTDEGFGKS